MNSHVSLFSIVKPRGPEDVMPELNDVTLVPNIRQQQQYVTLHTSIGESRLITESSAMNAIVMQLQAP
jgi:hypothetical protein